MSLCERILTIPSVSAIALARPLAMNGGTSPWRTGCRPPGSSCSVLPTPCDLRVRVDDRGDCVVVDVPRLPRHRLDRRDALFLGLVREHRPRDHVADRPHAGHGRPVVVVDLDEAALVHRDTELLRAQPVGVRPSTRGQPARDHRSASHPVLALVGHGHGLAVHAGAGDLDPQPDVETLLLEHLGRGPGRCPCRSRAGTSAGTRAG